MKFILYNLLFLILINFSISQDILPINRNSDIPKNIFLTKTIFPIFGSDSSRIDFHYFIPNNFLIYIKDSDTTYKAACEITLEIKNKLTDRSAIRKIQTREFLSSSPSSDDFSFINGIFSVFLKAGVYRIIFEVKDKESSRNFIDNKKEFEIPNTNNIITDVLFIEKFDTSNITSAKLINVSHGDIIPFNKSFYLYLELDKNYFEDINPLIELYEIKENQKNKISINFNYKLINSFRIVPVEDKVYYSFEENNNHTGLLIFLPYQNLNIGVYELSIQPQVGKKILKQNFQIAWIDMPNSLKDMRLAIDLLEYIATPEEIREMKVLNPMSIREKFDAFWKKFDPTPETVYNEAMNEYYRRADYAIEQFTTLRGELGAKTDRGKIFILYGNPSNIERVMLPRTTPKEIWIYTNLSKKFIFEDKNIDGNYKLIRIENL